MNSDTVSTIASWAKGNNIEFTSPEAKQQYQERTQRIADVIQLRIPDRVPFWFQDLGYFPCRYVGITFEKANYDLAEWFNANRTVLLEYQPDMFFNPGYTIPTSGRAYEVLDTLYMKWTGHGISPDVPHQYVEGEYMKADEYDAFLDDPSDYIIRTFLPRIFGKLTGLSLLPPLSYLVRGLPPIGEAFLLPEIQSSLEAMKISALEAQKWNQASIAFIKHMNGLGFHTFIGSAAAIPFYIISDRMRGMRGSMLDMYKRPEKMLAAMDKVLPMSINQAVAGARKSGNPGIFIAVHRGADGFMSQKQFETFYWPGVTKLVDALLKQNLIPCIFFEGDCTSRLDYMAALPKGQILGFFENTDIKLAKEKLGGVMALSGFMPLSILQVGTPEKVREHAKMLIDILGKNGGFLMGPKSIMDEARPDLVKTWVEYSKQYGVYGKAR